MFPSTWVTAHKNARANKKPTGHRGQMKDTEQRKQTKWESSAGSADRLLCTEHCPIFAGVQGSNARSLTAACLTFGTGRERLAWECTERGGIYGFTSSQRNDCAAPFNISWLRRNNLETAGTSENGEERPAPGTFKTNNSRLRPEDEHI